MAFYSLTQFNRDAGTRFTRWSQVVAIIKKTMEKKHA